MSSPSKESPSKVPGYFPNHSRGFFYGPKEDSPWNWDLLWKRSVSKEQQITRSFETKKEDFHSLMVHTHKAPFYNPYDLASAAAMVPLQRRTFEETGGTRQALSTPYHGIPKTPEGKRTYFFKSDRRKVCIKVFVGTPAQDIIDGAKIELGISAAHVHFTDESGDPVIVSSTAPDGSTFILKEGAPETTSSRRLTASRGSARPDTSASQRLRTSGSDVVRLTTANVPHTTASIRRHMDPVVSQNAETTARLMGQITGKCVDPGNPSKGRK